MIFWLIYLILTVALSYIFSSMVKNRFLKVLIFSFILSLFATFWFKNPGSNSLVPVFSIFLVESTIVENNGLIRILRPFSFIFSLIFIASLLFWKKY
ncbi:MAG: hypothetical protein ACJ0HB_00195 [Gammaproteobacteria bacterium]